MAGGNNLKPCQVEALKDKEWRESYDTDHLVQRVSCEKYDRHAEMWLSKGIINPLSCLQAERRLIHKLCEGCKEVQNGAETNPKMVTR